MKNVLCFFLPSAAYKNNSTVIKNKLAAPYRFYMLNINNIASMTAKKGLGV
jgi:hypothetical protein